MTRSVRMVIWSDTSLYHTLASSHMLSIQMMLGLPRLGYLSMMCRRHHLYPADVDGKQCMQMIAVIMDNLMSLVNPDGEVFTGLSREAHIARERPI